MKMLAATLAKPTITGLVKPKECALIAAFDEFAAFEVLE